jgi:hypothetical protein
VEICGGELRRSRSILDDQAELLKTAWIEVLRADVKRLTINGDEFGVIGKWLAIAPGGARTVAECRKAYVLAELRSRVCGGETRVDLNGPLQDLSNPFDRPAVAVPGRAPPPADSTIVIGSPATILLARIARRRSSNIASVAIAGLGRQERRSC